MYERDYDSNQYAYDVNFIISKLVGDNDDPQEHLNARVMLQNVIDYEPIHGAVVPLFSQPPTDRVRRPRPNFEDVRNI